MDCCLSMCGVWWLWWLEVWPAADFLSQCLDPTNCRLAVFPLILMPLHRLLASFFFKICLVFSSSHLLCRPSRFVLYFFLLFFLSSLSLSSFVPSFLSLTTRCVVSVPPHDVKRMAWNSTGNNSEQSQSSGPAAPLGGSAAATVNNIANQSKNTACPPRPLPSCRSTLKPQAAWWSERHSSFCFLLPFCVCVLHYSLLLWFIGVFF